MLYPAELRARVDILPRSEFSGMIEYSNPERTERLAFNASWRVQLHRVAYVRIPARWKEREIFWDAWCGGWNIRTRRSRGWRRHGRGLWARRLLRARNLFAARADAWKLPRRAKRGKSNWM